MAWPPPVLPINRTNSDPQQDTHPADHNALALAINDTAGFLIAGYPFPAGYRECTATNVVGVTSTGWGAVQVGTLGVSAGVGLSNDATSISVSGPGLYDIEMQVNFAALANGRRGIGWNINNTVPPTDNQFAVFDGNTTHPFFRTSTYITSPTGSRIMMWVLQDSGITLNISNRRTFVRRIA